MLIVQETQPGVFTEITVGMSFRDAEGVLHGWDATQAWTDEELAAVDVYRVEPAVLDTTKTVIGYGFNRVGSQIVQVITYSDVAPVPSQISDRQFFQQLAVAGIITEDDALASNAAVIPQPLLAIISNMPADQQFAAKMLVGGATIFERNHPMTIAIGTAYGWTSEQVDDFFRAASLL